MVVVKLITKNEACYVGPFPHTDAAEEWMEAFYASLDCASDLRDREEIALAE